LAALLAFGIDPAGFLDRTAFFFIRFVRLDFAIAEGFGAAARALSRAMASDTALAPTPGSSKEKPPPASRTMPISTPDATGSIRPRRGRGAAPSNAPMALTISRPSSSVMIVA